MYLDANNKKIFAYTGARPHLKGSESVVFIHGTGMDHTVWLLPSRYFAHHHFNVLATDLPGHGRSEGTASTSIEQMSDEVISAMDAARIANAAIVGHSMGSLIALALTARNPDRVRTIILIGTAVPMAVHKSLLRSAALNEHTAIDMLTYWGYSKAAQLGGNENPGMWMIGSTTKLLEQAQENLIKTDLEACHTYEAGMLHASQIKCPTLLILGSRDVMTPTRLGKEVSNAIHNSRILILEGAGHSLMMERPNEVLDALIEFI